MFAAVPHTLEDFALGEPAKNGVPLPVLAAVVAGLFTLQGLGLYSLGTQQRRGYFIHILLGIFWPLAAGSAQLPVILTMQPYRFGFISTFYVICMIVLGILLLLASAIGLRMASQMASRQEG
jgi:hypothetical protein